MPDPSAIRDALLARLNGDATLRAAIPGGAYWDVGPPSSRRHVIASLTAAAHVRAFGHRVLHDHVYLVKAVVMTSEPNAAALADTAAERIDALLENGTLTIQGFTLEGMYLDPGLDVLDSVEVDEIDPAIRWFHRGGQYRIVASPLDG